MGIRQLGGRDFRDADRAGNPPVVIVNRAFVDIYFRDRPAIGHRIRASRTDPFSEIVGIVENNSLGTAGEAPSPQVFFPWLQRPLSSQQRPLNIVVRTTVAPASMLRPIHAVTSRLDANAPTKTVTLRDATSFEFIVRRAGAQLLGGLGLLGWVLAAIGLYGIVSYVVASRTTEFGVRMALGATGAMIERDVVWRGLRLTLQGLGIGVLLALAGARLLASALAGLSPADPITFLATAALLVAMGITASYWPARRATRVDPMAALRRP
jgi:putative ABC transport system permease protein